MWAYPGLPTTVGVQVVVHEDDRDGPTGVVTPAVDKRTNDHTDSEVTSKRRIEIRPDYTN